MLQNVGQQEPGPLSRLGESPFPILVASHPHHARQDSALPATLPALPAPEERSRTAPLSCLLVYRNVTPPFCK